MFARALIVLLLVLNVGVAAWWALRPAQPPPSLAQPAGVPRLQLLSEARVDPGSRVADASPTPGDAGAGETALMPASGTAPARTTSKETPAPAAPRCFSLGPYASAEAAASAQSRLQPQVQQVVVRTEVVRTGAAAGARGWRVLMPSLPSADAARAMAKRIADAGFSDYLVLHGGDDANAIALGRYGTEATARSRVQALTAAGFKVRAEPLGGGDAATWLDVVAAPSFDAGRAQAVAAAPGRQPLDCARLPQ